MSLREDLITFPQAFVQALDEAARGALFGEHAGGEAFEDAADVDGIHNFLGVNARTTKPRVSSCVSTPSCARIGSDSRTGVRETPSLPQLNFAHALAGSKLAVQNHFADADDDARIFASHFVSVSVGSARMVSTPRRDMQGRMD